MSRTAGRGRIAWNCSVWQQLVIRLALLLRAISSPECSSLAVYPHLSQSYRGPSWYLCSWAVGWSRKHSSQELSLPKKEAGRSRLVSGSWCGWKLITILYSEFSAKPATHSSAVFCFMWWKKGRKAGSWIHVLGRWQCPWFHLFISWRSLSMSLFVFAVGLKIIVRCWKRPVVYEGVWSQYFVDRSGLNDYWVAACVCRDWLSDPAGVFQTNVSSTILPKSTLLLKLLKTNFFFTLYFTLASF